MGRTPLAGFELNAPPARLFTIRSQPRWDVFGSGVCGGKYPGLLVYWSATPHEPAIAPGHSGTFSFKVNTAGAGSMLYAISYARSRPVYGRTNGPLPSALPPSESCRGAT
jgi:hypothetical protein